jgi:hypothetical protein
MFKLLNGRSGAVNVRDFQNIAARKKVSGGAQGA